MADPVTTALGLIKPIFNDPAGANLWGGKLNNNMDVIDARMGGKASIAVTNVDKVLTPAQIGCGNIVFTGALVNPINAVVPAGSAGVFSVLNGTTGGYTVNFGMAGGAAVGLSPGLRTLVIMDGTDTFLADQSGVPPGTVFPLLSPNVPGGFILSYGQVLPQASQPGIYAAFGGLYNTGAEGAGNFRMPDLRGVVLAGRDNSGGTARGILTAFGAAGQTLGAFGGEQVHTILASEIPAHTHPVTDAGHSHGITDPGHAHLFTAYSASFTPGGAGTFPAPRADSGNSVATTSNATNVSVQAAATGIGVGNNIGGGGGHNNVQPTVLCDYMVKT